MAQFARPNADTYNADGWTDQGGGSTNIYLTIDETSASDADYVRSPLGPTSDVYVTALTTIEDPVSSTGHTVRWRQGKDASGGATITMTVEVRQGYTNEGTPGTLIATAQNAGTVEDTFTDKSYTLSGAEADSITNYGSLFLRFVANQV